MKRIILKENQFKMVINHRSDEILKKEILEEGFKDWALLGLMTLASIAGIKAQDTSIDSSYIKAAELVQDKLESGDDDLYQIFNDAQIKLNRENLEKLKSVSEKDFEDAKLEVYNTKSKSRLKSKQRQGFTVTDIKVTKDTILPKDSIVVIEDSLELDADNLFKTGSYMVSEESKNNIINIFDALSNIGEITSITIESSTDKEPIRSGNDELAKLRAESVKKIVDSFGVPNVKIVITPNQGPNVFNKNMSKEDRVEARKQTQQYRHVKISVVQEVTVETKTVAAKVMNRYEIEMVKLKQTFNSTKYRKKFFIKKTHKKPKCKKVKVKGKSIPCFFE
jgi:outer membrane protein OmpA-like peptidoglycan-associated protein